VEAGAFRFMMIESINPQSMERVLELNNAHAVELSYLDMRQLEALVATAFLAGRVGDADAFMLVFDQDAPYDNPNFNWLKQRFERFVYVDRIAVAASARGRGLARAMYEHVFDRARAAGHETVCCEVNAEPPNPASDAFHMNLGFDVIGQQAIHGGAKTVRYFARKI
jgi:uncharacterized protein